MLKTQHGTEQKALKLEIAMLKKQQASSPKMVVASEVATLKTELAKLREEHLALKNVYSSKLQAIGQNSPETAQVYTILVDISHLTLGGSLTLGLSNTNRKSGHHYIVLSQEPSKPEYKFKLEWKTHEPAIEEQGLQLSYLVYCPATSLS